MIVHDLEDKIMKVWNTADDLDIVLHFMDDAEVDSIDFKDQLMNLQ